jgi:hypothetical protein
MWRRRLRPGVAGRRDTVPALQVERMVGDFCHDGDRRGVARGRQHSPDLETPTVSQTVAMPHMKWQSWEEKCVLQCSAAE